MKLHKPMFSLRACTRTCCDASEYAARIHHEKDGRIERLVRAWQATHRASAWGQASSVPACDVAQFSKVSRARYADDRRAVRSLKEERSRKVLTGLNACQKWRCGSCTSIVRQPHQQYPLLSLLQCSTIRQVGCRRTERFENAVWRDARILHLCIHWQYRATGIYAPQLPRDST
jgi:hypothetical protein